MSQVLLLTRAIGRLETLKRESTPGPWQVTDERGQEFRFFGPGTAMMITADPDPTIIARGLEESDHPESDADLIVTLHRTIDAQLAILRWELERVSTPYGNKLALDLAHAILGDDV